MAKNQPAKPATAPAESPVTTDADAGTSGAEVAVVVGEAPALAGADDATTLIVEGVDVTVRVLVTALIGVERYEPDTVLEGVPQAVVGAHQGEVDAHPDAVAHALSIGAPVKQYAPMEATE